MKTDFTEAHNNAQKMLLRRIENKSKKFILLKPPEHLWGIYVIEAGKPDVLIRQIVEQAPAAGQKAP